MSELPLTCGRCRFSNTANHGVTVTCRHENLDWTENSRERGFSDPPPSDPDLCPLQRPAIPVPLFTEIEKKAIRRFWEMVDAEAQRMMLQPPYKLEGMPFNAATKLLAELEAAER